MNGQLVQVCCPSGSSPELIDPVENSSREVVEFLAEVDARRRRESRVPPAGRLLEESPPRCLAPHRRVGAGSRNNSMGQRNSKPISLGRRQVSETTPLKDRPPAWTIPGRLPASQAETGPTTGRPVLQRRDYSRLPVHEKFVDLPPENVRGLRSTVTSSCYHFGDVTVDRNPGRHIARGEDRRISHGPAAGNNLVAGVRGSPVAGPVSAWDAGSRPGDRPGDWSDPSAAWSRSVGRRDRLGVAAFDPRVVRLPAPTRRCGARHRGGDSSNNRPAGGTRDSRVASSTSAQLHHFPARVLDWVNQLRGGAARTTDLYQLAVHDQLGLPRRPRFGKRRVPFYPLQTDLYGRDRRSFTHYFAKKSLSWYAPNIRP